MAFNESVLDAAKRRQKNIDIFSCMKHGTQCSYTFRERACVSQKVIKSLKNFFGVCSVRRSQTIYVSYVIGYFCSSNEQDRWILWTCGVLWMLSPTIFCELFTSAKVRQDPIKNMKFKNKFLFFTSISCYRVRLGDGSGCIADDAKFHILEQNARNVESEELSSVTPSDSQQEAEFWQPLQMTISMNVEGWNMSDKRALVHYLHE